MAGDLTAAIFASILAVASGRPTEAERWDREVLCAVQARVVLHRGNIAAARRELLSAHELRPLLTCAIPHLAIQFRIELIRVHLVLSESGDSCQMGFLMPMA